MKFTNGIRFPLLLMMAFVSIGVSQLRAANTEPVCTRVRFFPAPGGEKYMVGGAFSGSNLSRTEGFEALAEIKTAPPTDQWSEITLPNTKVYRWLRYIGPPGSQKRAARIEFYAGDEVLSARGKSATYHSFELEAADQQFNGFDLLDAATAHRPSFKPDRAQQDGPMDVTLGSTRGAVIRYTLDGSWPTADHGEVYTAPIHVDKTATIEAVAFLEGRAPSMPSDMTYLLRGSSRPGLSTAHVGNSLTGTTSSFFRYARSAGYDHTSVAFLRGGALTKELWGIASGTVASDKAALAKEEANLKRGSEHWDDFWKKVTTVDLLTVQPRDFDIAEEADRDIKFFNLFRQKSPDLQPWFYCEWTEMNRQRPTDKGEVASSQMKKTFPALTWEESMSAMLLYVEELQRTVGQTYHEGKRPRVLPTALAMGWIKNMIDHGKLPGVKPGSFYPLLFGDQVHPAAGPVNGSANGAYLVDMTWYSAFYRESPEGKVLPVETTFTPEQSAIIQRLAWDVIKNYPDCGLYEDGAIPCGKPEFAAAGQPVEGVTPVTLSSSTPGAWFRYTLDGTDPTRTRGYVYCGVVSVRPGMTLKAVAYKSGMADGPVASATYP
jgi:hypothetical protein